MEIEYTPEMIDEFKKCSEDPVYFIGKYIAPVNERSGEVIPVERQFDTINAFHNNVLLYTRNSNIQMVAAYFLWRALFKHDRSFLYISKNIEKSQKFLTHINQMYEDVPEFIKFERAVSCQYKRVTGFTNGCRILIAIPSNVSCVICGVTLDMVFVDDYLECVKLLKEPLYMIMPALQPGGKMIQNCVVQ